MEIQAGFDGGGGDRTRVVLLANALDANDLAKMAELGAANALHSNGIDSLSMTTIVIKDILLTQLILNWHLIPAATRSLLGDQLPADND